MPEQTAERTPATVELPETVVLDAIAGLMAANELLHLLGGSNDTTALADPFAREAETLRGAAFELPPHGLSDDAADRAYNEHPAVVEIEARTYCLLAEVLTRFGLHGVASQAEAHVAALKNAGMIGVDVRLITCPPYLPPEHSETVGFIYAALGQLGLTNPYERWGGILQDVQGATSAEQLENARHAAAARNDLARRKASRGSDRG